MKKARNMEGVRSMWKAKEGIATDSSNENKEWVKRNRAMNVKNTSSREIQSIIVKEEMEDTLWETLTK